MYRCCDAWGVFYVTNGRNGRLHECRKGKTPSAPRKVQQPGLAPPREERWWCFAKIKKEVGPVPFLILPCHALSWTRKAKKNYLEDRIKDQINIPLPIHRNVCHCYNESPHLGVGRLGQQHTSRLTLVVSVNHIMVYNLSPKAHEHCILSFVTLPAYCLLFQQSV